MSTDSYHIFCEIAEPYRNHEYIKSAYLRSLFYDDTQWCQQRYWALQPKKRGEVLALLRGLEALRKASHGRAILRIWDTPDKRLRHQMYELCTRHSVMSASDTVNEFKWYVSILCPTLQSFIIGDDYERTTALPVYRFDDISYRSASVNSGVPATNAARGDNTHLPDTKGVGDSASRSEGIRVVQTPKRPTITVTPCEE